MLTLIFAQNHPELPACSRLLVVLSNKRFAALELIDARAAAEVERMLFINGKLED